MLPGLYEDRRYSAHFSFFPPNSRRLCSIQSFENSSKELANFDSVCFGWKLKEMSLWILVCISFLRLEFPMKRYGFLWSERNGNEKKENLSYFSSVYIIIFRIFEYFFFFFPFDTLCLSRIYYLLIRLHLLAKILTVSNIR